MRLDLLISEIAECDPSLTTQQIADEIKRVLTAEEFHEAFDQALCGYISARVVVSEGMPRQLGHRWAPFTYIEPV